MNRYLMHLKQVDQELLVAEGLQLHLDHQKLAHVNFAEVKLEDITSQELETRRLIILIVNAQYTNGQE